MTLFLIFTWIVIGAVLIHSYWENIRPFARHWLHPWLWECKHNGRYGQDYIKDVDKGIWYYKCKECGHMLENGKL